MKSIINFSIIILLVAFSSCNEPVQDSYKEVEADLNIDIPIKSTLKSHDKTSEFDHEFSGSNEYDISNIVYQTKTISNIYNIIPRNGSVIVIDEIMENYEVTSLSLNWNYKSLFDPNNIVNESIDLLTLDYTGPRN